MGDWTIRKKWTQLGFLVLSVLSLVACQQDPVGVQVSPEPQWTLKHQLLQRPRPQNIEEIDLECQEMAELYTSAMVAAATWTYAKTPKVSQAALADAMAGAQARSLQLGCHPFWREQP